MVTSLVDLVNDNETDRLLTWTACRRRSYLASIITIVTIAYTSKVNNEYESEEIIKVTII